MKKLPVTVTIPTHNNSRSFTIPSNVKSSPTVLKGGNSITSVSLSSLLTQQRSLLPTAANMQGSNAAKSTMEISQLVRKATPPASSTDAVSNRHAVSLSGSGMLTVTGRPIQSTPRPSSKNPQTITLHIPNTAMLKDSNKMRSAGPEIKLIGLLNQTGKSPISSPIHLSMQSKSAPGSPLSQSPTLVVTSKSDPPTPILTKIPEFGNGSNVPVSSALKDETSVEATTGSTLDAKTGSPVTSVKQLKPVASEGISESMNPQSSKNPNKGIKFSKPATVQTALIKSLTAASLSAQQQESISNLVGNQSSKKSVSSETKKLASNPSTVNQNSKRAKNGSSDMQKGEADDRHKQLHVAAKPTAVNGHKPVNSSMIKTRNKSTENHEETTGETATKSLAENRSTLKDKDSITEKSSLLTKSKTTGNTSMAADHAHMNIKSVAARIVRISLDNDELAKHGMKDQKFVSKDADITEIHGGTKASVASGAHRKEVENSNNSRKQVAVDAGTVSQEDAGAVKLTASSHLSNNNVTSQNRKRKIVDDVANRLDGCNDATTEEDHMGPSARKRLTRKSSSSDSEKQRVATPQKTEE